MKDKELVKKLQAGHGEWANEMTVVSNVILYWIILITDLLHCRCSGVVKMKSGLGRVVPKAGAYIYTGFCSMMRQGEFLLPT